MYCTCDGQTLLEHAQYSRLRSIIAVSASRPSEPTTSPIPGARSSTRRCGIVPSTRRATSPAPYPTALSPRGTPSPSRNAAIASKSAGPTSASVRRATRSSCTSVRKKIARASRCRPGEAGAVYWNTSWAREARATQSSAVHKPAGPVRATEMPCGIIGVLTT
jgi:hypothetical protein